MLKIKEAIVVEGRYDKNTLSQMVNTLILTTDGFQVFKRKEQETLLRRVAQQRGLIVLTDSDGAGFVIRNHLKGMIPAQYLKQCYIPDIYGKEKRKKTAGKEGKLGVEGMKPEVLTTALLQCGATVLGEAETSMTQEPITKADLFALGLTGGANSEQRRQALRKALDLPEHLSTNALLAVVNTLFTRQEFIEVAERLHCHQSA